METIVAGDIVKYRLHEALSTELADRELGKLSKLVGKDRVTNHGLKAFKKSSGNGRKPNTATEPVMRLETRVFDLYQERYGNLTELARGMGISVSQIYRVRKGKRPINEKFITGTVKAFPGYKLDDLFCVVPGERCCDSR